MYVRDRVEEKVETACTKSLEDAAFHVCGSSNMAKRASECIKEERVGSSILVRVTAEDLRSTRWRIKINQL